MLFNVSPFEYLTVIGTMIAPIGSIVAWHGSPFGLTPPHGWLLCDGSVILEGPFKGNSTPNLNGEARFLRGGVGGNVGTFQEDQIQDHPHSVSDAGHTHTDTGHYHDYYDYYRSTTYGCYEGSYASMNYGNSNNRRTSQRGQASISTSNANVQVNGIYSGSKGTETRPKNMIVEWIIRIL